MDNKTLPTVYDPTKVEGKWYEYWTKKDYFHADADETKKPYSITIPPPNVTGSLHIGHALCYSIQDVLIRLKRMQGYNAMCLPGTDHAGIATQNKVEQQLAGEGKNRHELGREKFLERVWAWKEKYGGEILHQFKTMGFSFDWERERFTMDPGYQEAVFESFIRLFEKGYIYKGVRVINWCARCHTAISDIEVEYEDRSGNLWHLVYPLADGSGEIVVATTRPETMLGDTAVMVNPADDRYKNLVGKEVKLPLTDRVIPIIADDFVDMEFGTGAVKTTPAHDPNDFEAGIRHNLPQVVVIGPDGNMTAEAGAKYEGMTRQEARKAVVSDLEEQGLLLKIEDHQHAVGTCERCHETIEPLLSEQWFCKMEELAKPAIDAVKSGRVRFVPDRYERIYIDWMENVKDWCISRQLWWGHRIPVYKNLDTGEYFAARSMEEAVKKAGSKNLEQDPDVLDTWFSSALWPFATMGWPQENDDLDYFYPTDVLVTSREIIYLWVARMIFSSMEYLDGEIPFSDVYIYATVLNEEGKRMSKSLGTGVDPLELIDKYGADALRFALIAQTGKNQDIRFSDKRVEVVRNFCNKIWNASRFVIMNLEDFDGENMVAASALKLEDRWIISRLNKTIDAVTKGLENYDMDKAAQALYDFTWNEFCDWYLELAKPRLRGEEVEVMQVQSLLYDVLETVMRLMHPIMPFITEEIWQALPGAGDSIMVSEFPTYDADAVDEDAEKEMDLVMETVRSIRNLRAEINAAPSKMVNVVIAATEKNRAALEKNAPATCALARVENLEFVESVADEDKSKYVSANLPGVDIYMEVAGLIDREKELSRIDAELKNLEGELARVNGKLSNEKFTSKAPPEIVEKEKRIKAELDEKKEKLMERKSLLG